MRDFDKLKLEFVYVSLLLNIVSTKYKGIRG